MCLAFDAALLRGARVLEAAEDAEEDAEEEAAEEAAEEEEEVAARNTNHILPYDVRARRVGTSP
jgi:hypothetical protein